jgi:cob(I)alamin adenosyltransferase
VQRLHRILTLRRLGFGLETIAGVLESNSSESLLEAARRQLERVEVELQVGRGLRARLRGVVRALEASAEGTANDTIDEMEVMRMGAKLTHIYTGLGDAGETELGDMERVRKTHPVIEAGGAIEELGTKIGELLASGELPDRRRSWLMRITNDLMDIAFDLSVPPGSVARRSRPQIGEEYVAWVEEACDEANAPLEELDSFVVSFGDPIAAQLDACRAICRRAERRAFAVEGLNPQIARYLNRLSDLLFILARASADGDEQLWKPGGGAELAAR